MEFKDLKKELQDVFSAIQEKASTGELPESDHITTFIRLCRQMHSQAAEEWEAESEDFLHMALQLNKAVKNRDVQASIMLIESLDDARTFCHENFQP